MCLPFLAGYYTSYIFRAVNAVLGPLLAAEVGLTASQLGLLTGIYFFSFGLFQIPLGVLLDRFGPRRTNAALLLLAAAGAALFGAAASYPELVLARALIGLGVSACLMGGIQAFVLWYPPERTATMIAIAYAMGGLGAMTASVPLEIALRTVSWREVFFFLGAVSLFLSAVFAFWVPEHPGTRRPASWRAQVAGLGTLLREGAFWRIALALGANQCAVVAVFTLWITLWLRDVAGYDRPAAARAFFLVSCALIAGYLVFGRMADALARRGASVLNLFMAGMALTLAMLLPLAFGVTTGAVALWSGFIFFGAGATVAHSIAMRRYPREMAGRVNTALNSFTFLGIFLGQWGTGAVLNLFPPLPGGYDPRGYVWALGGLCTIQAAGLAWVYTGRRKLEVA